MEGAIQTYINQCLGCSSVRLFAVGAFHYSRNIGQPYTPACCRFDHCSYVCLPTAIIDTMRLLVLLFLLWRPEVSPDILRWRTSWEIAPQLESHLQMMTGTPLQVSNSHGWHFQCGTRPHSCFSMHKPQKCSRAAKKQRHQLHHVWRMTLQSNVACWLACLGLRKQPNDWNLMGW